MPTLLLAAKEAFPGEVKMDGIATWADKALKRLDSESESSSSEDDSDSSMSGPE